MLFVQGTRDELAQPALLEQVLQSLQARATVHWVDEADHSFHVPARCGAQGRAGTPRPARGSRGVDGGSRMSPRALERYAAKRSFTRTPEPPAKAAAARARAAVVRRAEARRAPPALRLPPGTRRRAQVLGRAQGPLLRSGRQAHGGGSRGSPVRLRLLRGCRSRRSSTARATSSSGTAARTRPMRRSSTPSTIARTPQQRVRAELAAGKLSFFLCGEKLKGSYTLVRTRRSKQWLLIKHKDRFARRNDLLARHRSVLSAPASRRWRRSQVTQRLDAAAPRAQRASGEPCPRGIEADAGRERRDAAPLIRSGATSRSSTAIASSPSSIRGEVRLQSRRGLDLTPFFPGARRRILRPSRAAGMILDGEIVALDASGRPSFNALQNRAQLKSAAEIAAAQRARRWSWCALTCCTSPASICAGRPTPTGAATCHSACCRPRTCSWCTALRERARSSTAPRSISASKASWRSDATAAYHPG